MNSSHDLLDHASDPGLTALVTIARFHNIAADAAQLKHAAALDTTHFTGKDLILTARSLCLKARIVPLGAQTLSSTPLPALVLDREGRLFILAKADGKTALILEAGAPAPTVRPLEEIAARSTGEIILFASRSSLAGELARFDFSWFIPAIVPDDALEVEARLQNRDIGFVQVGQPAAVKIEAFPYTRYGYLDGTITAVSNDAVQDKKLRLTFPVRIRLVTNRIHVDNRWIALTPGMAVTADIRTGKRSVIGYFLEPLMRTATEGMRER